MVVNFNNFTEIGVNGSFVATATITIIIIIERLNKFGTDMSNVPHLYAWYIVVAITS